MARAPDRDEFLEDVLAGLNACPRTLPCKYFYDQRGSELFEALCECPEYYVTRADLALHEAHLEEISAMIGPDAHVIEFGSGAGIKTHKLLAALDSPRAYTPIEISESALAASAKELEQEFPEIEIRPLQADYTQDIDADRLNLDPPSRRRVIYFPGSTIGNFDHAEALAFLERMGRMARSHGAILIGVDLIKPVEQLIAAYDDAQGKTAAFNINLLQRMQRELGADIEIGAFAHEARFNHAESRIEMHLVALRPTRMQVGGMGFDFNEGDSIHTENSHKYSVSDFQQLARRAGLIPIEVWTDPDALFSMHWIEAP
ncbi:MAG: L-histidine N(alpha)-methyltransferase [Wenzhouxiangella sp.]|jgi:dimethylhistidine N-methyltransferase|nr:L-histidine N(alpha)-methyltransferase [Wenzhouxiangella sp.]